MKIGPADANGMIWFRSMNESGKLTYTPRVSRMLDGAAQIARGYGHSHLGTEHLLLAMLADSRGIATQAIARHIDLDDLARDVREVMGSDGYRQSTGNVAQ